MTSLPTGEGWRSLGTVMALFTGKGSGNLTDEEADIHGQVA